MFLKIRMEGMSYNNLFLSYEFHMSMCKLYKPERILRNLYMVFKYKYYLNTKSNV